jgi:hypothetical protein
MGFIRSALHRFGGVSLGLALGLLAAAGPARADTAMFTFGEMLRLQALPLAATDHRLSDEELILYRNMEFYTVTVFETLIAANNAAITLHGEPLFCAPARAFRFLEKGDITGLAVYVIEELLALTETIGSSPERYDERPASEVLLLAVRAAFPCGSSPATLAAVR